ncbi:hypothetical protein BZA77DRAFT_96298 [Pyronema omphalodes]|nr:hypothetical protein BZA77DRAFT_96298 [Pyronema omphalodes]
MNAFLAIAFMLTFFLAIWFMRRIWIQNAVDHEETERWKHFNGMRMNPDNQHGNRINVVVDDHSNMPTRPLASHLHNRSADQLPLYEAAPPDYSSIYNKGAALPPQYGTNGASEAWQHVHLGAPAPPPVALDHPALANNESTRNVQATPSETRGDRIPDVWSRLRGA